MISRFKCKHINKLSHEVAKMFSEISLISFSLLVSAVPDLGRQQSHLIHSRPEQKSITQFHNNYCRHIATAFPTMPTYTQLQLRPCPAGRYIG